MTRIIISSCFCVLALTATAFAGGQFQNGLTHRPRVGFDGRDGAHTARVLQRINTQQEPWAGAYGALRDLAERGQAVAHGVSGWKQKPDKWAVLYGQETRNGQIATAKAAVAWLYTQGLDPAWRPLPRLPGESTPDGWVRAQVDQARAIVDGVYDDWPCWKGFKVINRGIVAADSLTMNAAAFDLLAALPAAFRPSLDVAERRLGDLASDLNYWAFILASQRNNHTTRVASGLGMAALVLNRHDRYRWYKPGTWWHRPKRWMAKAVKRLHPTRRSSALRHQGEMGAYAEGTSYYHYAADLHQPFFSTYHRFLSGGGTPFLASDLVNDLARWSVGLRLPDGRRPIVDNARVFKDTTPGYFFSRVANGVRGAADQELFLWDWKRAGYPGSRGRRAVFLLGTDPTDQLVQRVDAMAEPSFGPSLIQASLGSATLRSGWGPDAAHTLVLAQSGDVRKRGGGHESVANGAFAYFVHGDHVTIDPGYFGFTGVKKTHKGEHRSMVLVDGKAPKPAHKALGFLGWVSGGKDTRVISGPRTQTQHAEVQSVQVASRYERADIGRTVLLVGDRYLLVEDRCSARRSKTYTTQVQTNAGQAKARPLSVSGQTVSYETNRKRLPVSVGAVGTAPLSVRVTRRESSMGESPNGHDAIEFSARGSNVRFLTAIAAEPNGASAPRVAGLTCSGGGLALRIAARGEIDVVVSNPGGATVQVAAATGTPVVTTDYEIVVVRFDATGAGRTVWSLGSGSVTY